MDTLVYFGRFLLLSCDVQKAQPEKKKKEKAAKKEKKEKEPEDDGSRDLGMPAEEKKAPHPLAIMDKEAKSPFAGDTWKKVKWFLR